MDNGTRRIGRKPFTALGLSLAGIIGGLAVVGIYAAYGELTAPAGIAFALAGAFIVALSVFLDKTWAKVRSFVILGKTTGQAAPASEETERIPAARAGFDYRAAAVRATVLPLAAAPLVGLATGEFVTFLLFGVGFAALANLFVLVLALVLRHRRWSA